jgi:hypothetical protein
MTDAELSNLALNHLNISVSISDMDENSKEAKACKRWLPFVKSELLVMAKPRFAKVINDLALVEENPNDKWSYSYRYPSTCVHAIKIPYFAANSVIFDQRDLDAVNIVDAQQSFDTGFDSEGMLIFSNVDGASLEFISNEFPSANYPIKYAMALTYLLAFYVAGSLVAGDAEQVKTNVYSLFEKKLAEAQAAIENEITHRRSNNSDLTKGRI